MVSLSFQKRILRDAWRIAPKAVYSKLLGWISRRRLPGFLQTWMNRAFAGWFGINTDEADGALSDYPSLQAFFTRKLKTGARSFQHGDLALLSVCDGVVCDAGIAQSGLLLQAKGAEFSLETLLADKKAASRLTGGPYVIIYLSPQDYHRVHSPVTGQITSWVHVPGHLFPVGPRSVEREPGLFAKNERLVIHIETKDGLCSVVMVAAVGVGHITACFDPTVATHHPNFNPQKIILRNDFSPPIPIQRGEELGIFNLGSTTITIFEPGRVMLHPLPKNSPIQVGSEIGRIQ